MAGCAWCQTAIQTDWWLTEDQWRGNCTSGTVTYNAANLPGTVAATVLDDLPLWAFAPVVGDTWNPALASAIAVGGASSTADTATNTRLTGGGGGSSTTRFGFPTTTSSYRGSYSYSNYPYGSYDGVVRAAGIGAAAAVGEYKH
jgi:hypothetical protein